MTARSLVIKITAGKDDPERCNQALNVAAAAIVSGVPVSLWLTGEAVLVRAARKGRRFHPAARSPLTDLLASVLSGGTVSLCTQCAARRDIAPEDVIPGVRIAGASTFVAEVMADGAQALVY